jgi:hypothetical protein
MLIAAQAITASGLATIAASSPILRRTVRTFFVPVGRHRAASPKSD